MRKILILMVIVLFLVGGVSATDYYVAQTAAGTGDGISYDNRASVATHNSGTGVFADLAGDTIIMTGEFTSTLKIINSGSAGNFVIYNGDDGVHPPLRYLTSQNPAINIDNKDYIELKNLVFFNYSHSSNSGSAISVKNGCNNIKIHNCLFDITLSKAYSPHDVIWVQHHGSNIEINNNIINSPEIFDTIIVSQGTQSGDLVNVSIHHNTIKGCNHNLIYVDNGWPPPVDLTSQIKNIKIYNNDLSAPDNPYCRGWSLAGSAPGMMGIDNAYVYNNYIHDLRAGNQIKSASNVYVYNNLITNHHSCCVDVGISCEGPDSGCKKKYWNCGCWGGISGISISNPYGNVGPAYIFKNTFFNISRAGISIINGFTDFIDHDINIWDNLIVNTDIAPNIDFNGSPRKDTAPIIISRRDDSTRYDCFGGNLSINNNLIFNFIHNQAIRICDPILTVNELNTENFASENLATDPLFIEPFNPKGPDGIIWTDDDGLKLQPTSPACTASETGSYIGAYSCLSTSTCQSLNYNCCDSCESGAQPLYDGDCPGVCCGVCVTPSACGDADSDFSGVVSITELINYITGWKAGSVSINDLINGITEWKNGC